MTNQERQQSIKAKITLSAQKLFFERGYTDVTISDIASEADVSRVTLFKYFGSKEDLAKAVVHNILEERMTDSLKIMSDNTLSFRQKFDAMVTSKKDYRLTMNDELMSSPFFSDVMLQKIFGQEMRDYFRQSMGQFIEEGKKEGALSKDIPSDAILDYMDFYYGFMQQNNILKKNSKYHTAIIDLFCYGLFGK
ncbi:MAG: TetR/AcrR family transcriptional regulator [Firmicutes bacterium]|nr:TetR/AcrR family transcriptional regulator [Bacillota bacterium]